MHLLALEMGQYRDSYPIDKSDFTVQIAMASKWVGEPTY